MRFWIASFTTLTAFNSPEKACENITPAPMLLTQPQTPESMNKSGEAAAHDRVKYLLTINEMSAHHRVKWLLTISEMRNQ
ncbi:hypothetical protein NKH99_30270 [Mesorhizobium sp. M0854]|uniref:hypothetical protein n=1 Tax=Mesorhizobium sp. M0854 TaxID=2957013 RepID=UPI00333BE67F